jgi:hypothetical protein
MESIAVLAKFSAYKSPQKSSGLLKFSALVFFHLVVCWVCWWTDSAAAYADCREAALPRVASTLYWYENTNQGTWVPAKGIHPLPTYACPTCCRRVQGPGNSPNLGPIHTGVSLFMISQCKLAIGLTIHWTKGSRTEHQSTRHWAWFNYWQRIL